MYAMPVDLLQSIGITDVVECIIFKIIVAQAPIRCSPNMPMRVDGKFVYDIIGERAGVIGNVAVDDEVAPVKAIEPISGAQPNETVPVFNDFLDRGGQAFIMGVMFKGNGLGLCGQVSDQQDAPKKYASRRIG
jgi:hypothetical protein